MKTEWDYKISDDRALTVYNEIVKGSEPELRFYIMVAVSTAIASFGLIQNSSAVVIGAMLVAPLMTPIFGIALSLIRGDTKLFGKAVKAESIGIVVAVFFALFLCFLLPGIEVTDEMLSRTRPNLIDLLVAVFAGFAGAYALIDEKISPALPGVAVATAIVPPLANVGLCISMGAYQGALGSFLLFFANFLSILLISSALFLYAGMSRDFPTISTKTYLRRFGLACLGFLVITAFLSRALYEIVVDRRITNDIKTVLVDELANLPATNIRQVLHHTENGKIYVMTHLYSPSDIMPARVRRIQNSLQSKLNNPVELFIRSTLSKDVSAEGLFNFVKMESLDGFYLSRKNNQRVVTLRLAEQIIREYLQATVGLYLEEMNLVNLSGKSYLLATVFGARQLTGSEIRSLEQKIREKSDDGSIHLVLRHVKVDLYDKSGLGYLELADLEGIDETHDAKQYEIEKEIEIIFSSSDHLLQNVITRFRQGSYLILVELVVRQDFTEAEYARLHESISSSSEAPIELYVRLIKDVVIAEQGPMSFNTFRQKLQPYVDEQLEKQMENIVQESL
jgi:uncharacterized hydrophobic protein (TIGR00271 family)